MANNADDIFRNNLALHFWNISRCEEIFPPIIYFCFHFTKHRLFSAIKRKKEK